MFPLWFALLGGSFVIFYVGPCILFLVFPLFGVLWFSFDWQGFIILKGTFSPSFEIKTKIGWVFQLQVYTRNSQF
jgi:hypothetical protein